jgi:hypothetical protein
MKKIGFTGMKLLALRNATARMAAFAGDIVVS